MAPLWVALASGPVQRARVRVGRGQHARRVTSRAKGREAARFSRATRDTRRPVLRANGSLLVGAALWARGSGSLYNTLRGATNQVCVFV